MSMSFKKAAQLQKVAQMLGNKVKYGKPNKYDFSAIVEWDGETYQTLDMLPSYNPDTVDVYIGCERNWGKRFKLYFVKK